MRFIHGHKRQILLLCEAHKGRIIEPFRRDIHDVVPTVQGPLHHDALLAGIQGTVEVGATDPSLLEGVRLIRRQGQKRETTRLNPGNIQARI